MISIVRIIQPIVQAYDDENKQRVVVELSGRSTDEKPLGYANGSLLKTTDNNKTYRFDQEHSTWIETHEGGGGGGTSNYNDLENKPQINGVTLQGNKTTQELHILASNSEVYDDYETMVEDVNDWASDKHGVGDNIFIRTGEVPDLWISGVETTSVPYTYTTDAAIVQALKSTGYIQVGYYKLSALETQKVDIPDIQIAGTSIVEQGVANIPHASQSEAGVIKTSSSYGFGVTNGNLFVSEKTHAQYESANNNMAVGKGTLENVITGKSQSYSCEMADGTTKTLTILGTLV